MIEVEERKAIASQLKQMRLLEKSKAYKEEAWSREIEDYLFCFNGLSGLFKYAKELNNGNRVLDLGSGTTKGISQISKSRLGEGLEFEATVLTNRPEVEENLGLKKTHITSAETLKGIKDNSVSVILALNSLAYSATPHIAIERIDKVLVPGGVIKATFQGKNIIDNEFAGEYNYQTHDQFTNCLRDLNYDVAVSDSVSEEIILAIKPGIRKTLLAQDLLRRDSGVLDILMKQEGHY